MSKASMIKMHALAVMALVFVAGLATRAQSMRDQFPIHQVDGARALIGGQSNAPPKGKQKHVAMPSENRSEYLSLPFVWSKPLQLFSSTATAMIEQDSGKGPRPCRRSPGHAELS